MTQPQDSPQVFDGTDIEVDPRDVVEPENDEPATTDSEQMNGDGSLGGAGGPGGAG